MNTLIDWLFAIPATSKERRALKVSLSATLKNGFDPRQPRDDHGRWSNSGKLPGKLSPGVINKLIYKATHPDAEGNQGYSYRPYHKAPRTGFMVSLPREGSELTLDPHTITPEAVGKFYDHARRILSQSKRAYMGAWYNADDGKIYLDISENVSTRAEAFRLGKRRKQWSIFDVSQKQVIWLRGEHAVTKQRKTKEQKPAPGGKLTHVVFPREISREEFIKVVMNLAKGQAKQQENGETSPK